MSRILVVGDVMLDHYMIGEAARISPEAPVPVVSIKREDIRPGGAANVAANIAAMGGDVTLLILTGADATTNELIKILEKYDLKFEAVYEPSASITRKSRVIASNQQVVRVDHDYRPSSEQQQLILNTFSDIVDEFDFIVFSDYAKGALDRLPEFIAIAKSKKKFTLVDPKRRDPNFYRGASLLKPNRKEFSELFGDNHGGPELSKMAQEAMRAFDIGSMVVTLGSEGMVVVEADEVPIELSTLAHEVFDVSGAGDTVLSSLALELSRGKNLSSAALRSNIAASIAVSRLGTYIVTSEDLKNGSAKEQFKCKKIISPDDLDFLLDQLKMSQKRIVFTNGCFDIIHPGHVRLLNQARSMGDVLIVGLNSDASVRALKGALRPINSIKSRAEVVSNLAAVDYVIEFDAPTPIELIYKIRPDVLVKGGDYQIKEIVGHDIVQKSGGQVLSLKFHDGYSTTRVINEMQS